MADRKHTKEVITILLLCILWYAVSSSNNVVGKTVLNEFPYPMTMTIVQLLPIAVLTGPVLNIWGIRKYVDVPWKYYLTIIVPLAFGKFLFSLFSHVSIWKVPVSYAHTVKATMPLFTVLLSRVLMGEKQSFTVYISLVPIIMGVGIATATELSFDIIGLISALCATMGFSLMHIFGKKVLKDTSMHHLRLMFILGRLALFMFLPIWLYFDFFTLLKDSSVTYHDYRVLGLLLIDGLLNWLQNIIAFTVLSLVTPLTYAVANASKRIFIIAVSLFILGNPVTGANVFGMVLAIIGVLFYNKAKYDARQAEQRQTVLPFSQNSWQDRTGYTKFYSNENFREKPLNGNVNGISSNNNSFNYVKQGNKNLLFV